MPAASPEESPPTGQGPPQHDPAPSSPAQQRRAAPPPPLTSALDTAAAAAAASSDSDPAVAILAALQRLHDHGSRREPAAAASAAAELARATERLKASLRSFMDFPIAGVNFIDILPLFQDPTAHELLLRALELQVSLHFSSSPPAPPPGAGAGTQSPSVTPATAAATPASPPPALRHPDVVVGLDARGFLFGPTLALRLGASFVPVRKKGKMPGPCHTAAYEKEYGTDYFQMQDGAIKPGQRVLVVDDIIATGGSAAAAGSLVKQLGGTLLGYLFILEIPFLKGREKLGDLPVVTLLEDE